MTVFPMENTISNAFYSCLMALFAVLGGVPHICHRPERRGFQYSFSDYTMACHNLPYCKSHWFTREFAVITRAVRILLKLQL